MKAINYINDSIKILESLRDQELILEIEKIVELILETFKRDGIIFIGGNGGSSADAEHFCAELVVRYKFKRKPIKCISLQSNMTTITATSNDFGYEKSLERNFEAFASEGDILIVLSTSGESKNINNCLKYSKKLGIKSIALLGKDGGDSASLSDHKIIIKSMETALIQQSHMVILHYIAMILELSAKDES